MKRLTRTEKLEVEIEGLIKEVNYWKQHYEIANAKLEIITKYTLNPVVSLQIALEKTVDCIAHVLTDLRKGGGVK